MTASSNPTINDFTPGQRVQAHPATDAWMRGDRYGFVTRLGRTYVHVKMRTSGKYLRFDPSNLLPVE